MKAVHSMFSIVRLNKSLFLKLLLLVICYAYARFIFMCLNPVFMQQSMGQILHVFWVGIRFDLSVIVYTNSLFILLELIPWNQFWSAKLKPISHVLFVVINAFFLFLNFIDSVYLKFSGKRSGVDLFLTSKEWSGQLSAYVQYYWYVLLLFLPIVFLLHLNKYTEANPLNAVSYYQKSKPKFALRTLLIVLLSFLGARGGLNLLPLNAGDAAKYTGARNTAFALNTGFNVLMSVQQQGLEAQIYFDTLTLEKNFNPIHVLKPDSAQHSNLVLIVLESFGKEYFGKQANGFSYTPFLDSLQLYCDNYIHAYANGKRSIEGIPAIVAAMPSWKGIQYLNSFYQNNNLEGLGAYLQNHGYDCSFYHGGKNGTMSFDNLISISKSGKYFGLNEYPNQAHFDGTWGVFDHHYLQYWAQELNQKKQPFYSALFTLSSHHPYTLPIEFEGKFNKGTLPIHKSIQYVDEALRQFFTLASKATWFTNTVFIITADHSSENEKPYFLSSQGQFQIPLMVFQPSMTKKGKNIATTVSQLDVMPLALTSLALADTCFGFGAYPQDSFAVQYQDGYWQMVQFPWVYQFDGKQGIALFQVENDSIQKQNLLNTNLPQQVQMDKKLKAVIQQYTVRLKNNQTHLH